MQSRKNHFLFQEQTAIIKVTSNFDSGNLESAILNGNTLTLLPALDPMNPQYSTKQSSKTFFHFSIISSESVTLQLVIKNMKILEYFANDEQFEQLYRVCIGRKASKNSTIPVKYYKQKLQNMRRVQFQGCLQLHFNMNLQANQQVFLAYNYPYPYEQCQVYLNSIQQKVNSLNQKGSNVFYRNELLIQSIEGRAVNLLTLTQNTGQLQKQQQQRITKSLFPYFQLEGRPHRYQKPYVMLTCRVHSGQTSSSYALEGIINFLLSQDKRAKQLLHYCVFLIVPMVNPDGVFHGTYRMDTLGHNLNRFYSTAQSHKQPSIFAIQTIAHYYASRLIFFMDLHGHPHPLKGSFIYGNSHSQIYQQTETQLFAKLLSLHSQCFGYQWSNFSSGQMNSRDANQLLTKDGSARVQMYKLLNHPFVFTMEMGCHGCPLKQRSEQDNYFYGSYQRNSNIFTSADFQKHGQSIMITLFRMLCLNSTCEMKSQTGRKLQEMRQEVCREIVDKEERFKQMDSFVYKKIKNITNIIQEQFWESLFKKYPFPISAESQTNKIDPQKVIPGALKGKMGKEKRQLSVNIGRTSRTLDPSPSKKPHLRSYKSTLESKEEMSNIFEEVIHQKKNYKYAKQLNLNFNPFPLTERKKIYNVVGNTRSVLKRHVMNDLNSCSIQNAQNAEQLNTIDIDAEYEMFKQKCYSQEKDVLRNYKLDHFGNKGSPNQEDMIEFVQKQDSFVLPRIPNRSKQKQKSFRVEVQLQQEYEKKYQMGPSSPSGISIKPTLRANAFRMRNLIKSIK